MDNICRVGGCALDCDCAKSVRQPPPAPAAVVAALGSAGDSGDRTQKSD